MNLRLRLAAACSLLLAAAAASAADPAVHATARYEVDGQRWLLRYCRAGDAPPAPLQLRADDRVALRHLDRIEPAPDRREGRSLYWRQPGADGCVQLDYALGAIAASQQGDIGYQAGGQLLSWSWTWWWRPAGQPHTELTVALPPGWRLSTPWPRCRNGRPDCWTVGATPPSWPAVVVLGRQAPRLARFAGGSVEALLLGRADLAAGGPLDGLAPAAAELLAQAPAGIPAAHLQLLVVAQARGGRGEPVGFGQLLRGGDGGVQLFVDSQADAAALRRDWVLPHELSHLLHPYLGDGRGRWLAEGLASYYQNLLRARAGRLRPDEAWQKLFEGFDRGRAAADGLALDALAEDMQRQRAFMRVYWAGAAFWLQAEVELRRRGHVGGLDAVLSRFARTHLPATRKWPPQQFLQALDQDLQAPLFVPLAARIGAARSFPPVAAELAELGLQWDGRRVRLLPTGGPGAGWRDAIMAPRR